MVMSLKQVAALLRRAGEVARRAVADIETTINGSRLNGELARRVPSLEPVLARKNSGPRFRSPIPAARGPQYRSYSILAAAKKPQLARTDIKKLVYTLEHPQFKYGTVTRPGIAHFSALAILRRPFTVALSFPSIPVHATSCAAVDFDLAPRVLLASRALTTSTAQAFADSISGQIAHLKAVSRDIQRVASLGELPISLEDGRVRIHFDNRTSQEVEALARDIGLSRAIISDVVKYSDESVPVGEGWACDEVSPGLSDSLSSMTSESVWTEL